MSTTFTDTKVNNCFITLLRYNLTERETLQSHKLNYFIKQWVMFLKKSNF